MSELIFQVQPRTSNILLPGRCCACRVTVVLDVKKAEAKRRPNGLIKQVGLTNVVRT